MVYHGPSSGCRACRNRRVKCDEGKPSCKNCLRRRQECPGYADVFDGAHRDQNKVVIRKAEKRRGVKDSSSPESSPESSGSSSSELVVSQAASQSEISLYKPTPLQWVMYSGPGEEEQTVAESSETNETLSEETLSRIPAMLKQNPEGQSVAFFFAYYSNIWPDKDAINGFSMAWNPMYKSASVTSPLRLATSAVCVNIAMMWCFRGCDARPARELFTKAVASTRKSIEDPTQSVSDELLMTALVFDLYDELVLHYVPTPPDYGKHKFGALAILKHRGAMNYKSPRAQLLASAVRHSLINHVLWMRTSLPEGAAELFTHRDSDTHKTMRLDVMSIQLGEIQARLWKLRTEMADLMTSKARLEAYQSLIEDALDVNDRLLSWHHANDTAPNWRPLYVFEDEVDPAIKEAGFYGSKCSVWTHLGIVELYNQWAFRRMLAFQIIRQSLADEPSLLLDPVNRMLFTKCNSEMQSLVDFTCESVPCHIGDTVLPRNPIYAKEMKFPTKIITDSLTQTSMAIPDPKGEYRRHAAASGGWMLFPHLVNIYRLAEPEDDSMPLVLRDGQLDWIKGQVKRLQTMFLFAEPVWFKRLQPSVAA